MTPSVQADNQKGPKVLSHTSKQGYQIAITHSLPLSGSSLIEVWCY